MPECGRLEQIGVRSGVGKREDEFAVCGVEVEKYPVVFDVAVAKSFKVPGKRMILVLGWQHLALCKHKDSQAFLSDQCKEIEEKNRMGKTRDLLKKIRDTKRYQEPMQRWA